MYKITLNDKKNNENVILQNIITIKHNNIITNILLNSPPFINGLESVCMMSTYMASEGSNLTIGSVWLK